MQEPYTTTLAKVAFKRIPLVCGASPFAHKRLYIFRQRPHALRGEHGGYAEGRGGLFLALDTVADVDCERFWEGGMESDSAALAGDFCVVIAITSSFWFSPRLRRRGGGGGGGLVPLLLSSSEYTK